MVAEIFLMKLRSDVMPQDLPDDKSTLVQVMAWCRQATSHYLSQCWPISMSPNSVTRPQWVNTLRREQNGRHFGEIIFKCIVLNENINKVTHNQSDGVSMSRRFHIILSPSRVWIPSPYLSHCHKANRKYKDYVYRKMLVQEYLKK